LCGSSFCTEPLIGFGVVIDIRSGIGKVSIKSIDNIAICSVLTSPSSHGERYIRFDIADGHMCELQGHVVVLFYSRNATHSLPGPGSQPIVANQSLPQIEEIHRSQSLSYSEAVGPTTSPMPEIIVRLQISPGGKFSRPYSNFVLRPKLTTADFFAWFCSETNFSGPVPRSSRHHSSAQSPVRLLFNLKDAMPYPRATEIGLGNEECFTYLRKDILAQCEKASGFCPEMREFAILVKVPGWVELHSPREDES
jgi:hypothetical protein